MSISTVVLTKNEEVNIIDCLETLRFCDEIIVIDDNSTDRTIDLIERFDREVKVFKRELNGDFSAQRKFGVEKTSNDWVLFVDADERITPDLATEIKENLSAEEYVGGFLIPRLDYMWGKQLKHGETGNIKLLRLFNKNKGNLKGKVHETWETKSNVKILLSPIYHYPHPSISAFLKEINFYTDIRAKELYEKGIKSNLLSIVLHTKGKFILNYFIKRGFQDGTAGLVHALLMSFHSFLVRGKLWLLWQKKQDS
ncbi:MAG: glycosyltransferase family 2 protein [Candidatus Levybacteria bacterium]|nr:glycosyltransferase family 2 protein [Candidatus Levybacteria bacterium]